MRNQLLKTITKANEIVAAIKEKIITGLPYRIPKAFIKWEALASLIAVEIAIAINPKRFITLEMDNCTETFAFNCTTWFIKNGPIYLLPRELQKGLLNSKISSDVVKDLEPVVPSMLILLEERIPTPSGKIDSIFVSLISKENPEWTAGSRFGITMPAKDAKDIKHDFVLTWTAMDTKTTIWSHGIGINKSGEIVTDTNKSIGADEFTDSDRQLMIKVQSLVFQILSVLQYEPEMLEDCVVTDLPGNGKGLGKGKSATKKSYLLPRWIGKNYRVRTEGKDKSGRSARSNQWHVDGFWVQGHYQRYYVGPKENQKAVWKRKEPIYKVVK